MDQFIQLIQNHPKGFAILALLVFFTLGASRPLKLMIISAVAAIAFYHFTNMYDVSIAILAVGIAVTLIDFTRHSRG